MDLRHRDRHANPEAAFARRGMGFSFIDEGANELSVIPAFDLPPPDPIVVSSAPSLMSDGFGAAPNAPVTAVKTKCRPSGRNRGNR